jgi:hypothetical protein
LLAFSANSQTYWIPKTAFLDSLYNWDKNISQITNTENQFFLPIVLPGKPHTQKLIKAAKGSLYILIDGTGQVYKATEQNSYQIAFTRIDSTYYFGYNFQAFDFFYHDTIFSFGGEGFWHSNGQLRYFRNGADWNIIKLNQEVLAQDYAINFLPDKSKLFYFQNRSIDDVTGEIKDDHTVTELNLSTKQNKILGIINKNLFSDFHLEINIPKLNSLFVLNGMQDAYLLRPFDNAVYKLKKNNNKYYDLVYPTANTGAPSNFFAVGDTVYFTFSPNYQMHSFVININDFEKEPYPLYKPIKNDINYHIFSIRLIIIIVVLLIIIVFLILRIKKNINIPIDYNLTELNDYNEVNNQLNFTSLEISLINKIINVSKENKSCSVEELNIALGLAKKSIEVQKQIRNSVLNNINYKFKEIYKQESDLILRIRSEEDKRYFRYYVSKENIEIYNGKL